MTEPRWTDVLAADDLSRGQARACRVGADRVALFRTEAGEVFAVDDHCPHEGYPLSKGEVRGNTLTCCWHGFRFDLAGGQCLKGDEAVRTYPVKQKDERILLDMTPPNRDAERDRRYESLEAGLLDGRMGQVARDVARLQHLGEPASELLRFVVGFDAQRAPWGTTHVLPVAADVLRILDREALSDDDAFLALLQPFEVASEGLVRRPKRHISETPAHASPTELRDAIEAADGPLSEAIMTALLSSGLGRDATRTLLLEACSAHFLDIGHHLIYVNKAFDLLAIWGWSAAVEIVPAVALRIANGTRHDTLPKWRWLSTHTAAAPDHVTTRGTRDPQRVEDLVALIETGARDAVAGAFVAAIAEGVDGRDLAAAVALGAGRRVLAFELAIDRARDHQDGWLDVTHAFTYADAVFAVAGHVGDETLPSALLLFGLAYVLMLRKLDANPTSQHAPKRTGDAGSAPVATSGDALRGALHHPWARPIIGAHRLKMCEAGKALMDATGSPIPWRAVERFLSAPITQRFTPRQAYDARRLVLDGKVPTTAL